MKKMFVFAVLGLVILPLLAADSSPETSSKTGRKVEKPIKFVLLKPDPLIGDWQGDGGLVAQVYSTSDGKYQANLLTAFDAENNVIAVLPGEASSGGGVTFTGNGWNGVIQNGHFIGKQADGKNFDLHRVTRTSPTEGAKPPKGAVILFDGNSLDAWAKKAGQSWLVEDGPAQWKLVDGAAEVVPGSDCIITHKKFGDCHLHLEFRTLSSPAKSAVFLQTRYEININESYGRLEGAATGGLDNTSKNTHPRIRPVFPPLSWQTFDVDFTAPRFDSANNKTANASITIFLNGVKLCEHQELAQPFGAASRLGEAPTGPLMLQDHTTPMQFRNIWLVEK